MRTFLPRFLFTAIILISTTFAANTAPARAAQAVETPEAAISAALQAYNTANSVWYAVAEYQQEGGLAYAVAGPADATEGFTVLLAEDTGASGWWALALGASDPAEYNRLLERFPESLLNEALKAIFRAPEASLPAPDLLSAEPLLANGNFTGHRLPWPYKTKAYVTQKDSYAGHMNQIDFDIGGLAVPNGDIYATKPGKVVFVKDSSSTTCQTSDGGCMQKFNVIVVEHGPTEYSWYLHIPYRSAVVSVGQQVGFGTKLAVEGNTGYSFGVHLHYMASKGHTAWTDPNNPDKAPWAMEITAVDFDEYSWADLVPTYAYQYTSQNGANLPPVCPAFGGALLYREAGYGCGGLLENSGYFFKNEPGFQELYGFNDQASSARVPAGGSMLLYQHGGRLGGKICLNASDDNFADNTFDNNQPVDNNVSSFEVFNTPGCPARPQVDLFAPDGELTAPAGGTQVGRSLTITANASDAHSGVQKVLFTAKWGGQESVIYADTGAPYSVTWDLCAAGVPDGSIELGLTVVDNAWNSTTNLPISVTKTYNCAAVPDGAWTVETWANPNLSGPPALQGQQQSTFLFKDWGAASPDPSIPADGWSTRFTRAFNFAGGIYRFHCQSAGGCRVLVDGQVRINAWQESEFGGADWTGSLTAGNHTIVVEYFDASGSARLETWWQGPGFLAPDQANLGGQWWAEIYGNAGLEGTPAVRTPAGETLRYAWGSGGPDPLLPSDNFSVRFSRAASFDCATYEFALTRDGPARLLVDGALFIEAWNEPSATETIRKSLTLTRGLHNLVVETADLTGTGTGTGGVALSWNAQSICPAAAVIESVSTHIARPNTRFSPVVQARLLESYLNPARGDGLSFASGNNLSAGTSIARQVVEAGQTYTFDSSNGFSMIAPAANGLHSGQWQVTAGGFAISAAAAIQVMVDGAPPQVSISAPVSPLRSAVTTVRASATDTHSGVSHVQFLVWANAGGGAAWHNLGWDTNGADGWSIDWNTAGFPDQNGVSFLAAAWDKAGNYTETRSSAMMLDRTPPAVSITGPAAVLDSTRFEVRWEGSDNLSGLHHFDVQVMVDGGAAQNWLTNVPASTRSGWFTGEMGRSYTFRARAVDAAGNASSYTAPTAAALVRQCAPDAAEPDNTPGQARAINPGSPNASRNHCGVGDADWYVFEARAGQHYLLSALGLGLTSDTVLSLYAADGQTLLAENDNMSASDKGSLLVWAAREDGPLYFRIRQADPRVTGSAVTYIPRVDEVMPFYLPMLLR